MGWCHLLLQLCSSSSQMYLHLCSEYIQCLCISIYNYTYIYNMYVCILCIYSLVILEIMLALISPLKFAPEFGLQWFLWAGAISGDVDWHLLVWWIGGNSCGHWWNYKSAKELGKRQLVVFSNQRHGTRILLELNWTNMPCRVPGTTQVCFMFWLLCPLWSRGCILELAAGVMVGVKFAMEKECGDQLNGVLGLGLGPRNLVITIFLV